jgi:hypothetical protein
MSILLNDLEGVSIKDTKALFFKKPSDIDVIFHNGYAATAADTNGAINIWKDEDDNIRCEAMRHLVSIDDKVYENLLDVKMWAKKWLAKIK